MREGGREGGREGEGGGRGRRRREGGEGGREGGREGGSEGAFNESKRYFPNIKLQTTHIISILALSQNLEAC